MPHYPKPFFRESRQLWYVQLNGRQINLGPNRDAAFTRYHDLNDGTALKNAKMAVRSDPRIGPHVARDEIKRVDCSAAHDLGITSNWIMMSLFDKVLGQQQQLSIFYGGNCGDRREAVSRPNSCWRVGSDGTWGEAAETDRGGALFGRCRCSDIDRG